MNRFELWSLCRAASKDTDRLSIAEPFSDGRLIAATDGHRLHMAYHTADVGVIIPPTKPKKAERDLPADLQIRECGAQRPPVERVIPKASDVPHGVTLFAEYGPKCTAAIGRCDPDYFVVTLTVDKGLSVVFKAGASSGSVADVHLNPRYVAEAIEFVSGGGKRPVRVYFGDKITPVVFRRANGDSQIQAIVMPIRKC